MYASSRLRRFEISVLPPVHSRISARETLLWCYLVPRVSRERRGLMSAFLRTLVLCTLPVWTSAVKHSGYIYDARLYWLLSALGFKGVTFSKHRNRQFIRVLSFDGHPKERAEFRVPGRLRFSYNMLTHFGALGRRLREACFSSKVGSKPASNPAIP